MIEDVLTYVVMILILIFWIWVFWDLFKALGLFLIRVIRSFRDALSDGTFKLYIKYTLAVVAIIGIPFLIVTNLLFFLGLALFIFLTVAIGVLIYNLFFDR